MKSKTNYALDTNILVHALDTNDEYFKNCIRLVECLFDENQPVYVSDTVLYEYFAVLSNTYFKHDTSLATRTYEIMLEGVLSAKKLLTTTQNTPRITLSFLKNKGYSGKSIHSLLQSAILIEHEVYTIITYDTKSFENIPNLYAVLPEDFRPQ